MTIALIRDKDKKTQTQTQKEEGHVNTDSRGYKDAPTSQETRRIAWRPQTPEEAARILP